MQRLFEMILMTCSHSYHRTCNMLYTFESQKEGTFITGWGGVGGAGTRKTKVVGGLAFREMKRGLFSHFLTSYVSILDKKGKRLIKVVC